ncbi:bombesin receptor-activated protein C6orf89 homolog isoform X8 [Rattus norvegicus]|uniref:bombesin receptor-activated protein C6orf89 homolog isoform X8 n=1 Tax=Rattus norvegicus TaxID=10116 RepID=UPI002FD85CE8
MVKPLLRNRTQSSELPSEAKLLSARLDPLSGDFDPWSSNNCEQNESEPIPANCTVCAQILPLKVTLPEDTPKNFERLRPLVIKTGQPLLSAEIQSFSCQYPEVTEGFTEGVLTKWWRCFPERWFPFPYPWRRPLNRSQILRELFPVFTQLPFPKDASLNKCFLIQPEPVVGSKMHEVHDLFTIGSGEAMLQLIPPFQCRRHCQSVAMPIESGDIGDLSLVPVAWMCSAHHLHSNVQVSVSPCPAEARGLGSQSATMIPEMETKAS